MEFGEFDVYTYLHVLARIGTATTIILAVVLQYIPWHLADGPSLSLEGTAARNRQQSQRPFDHTLQVGAERLIE